LVLTTCLPYVEVVSNRKLRADDLASIQFDQDRIYLDQPLDPIFLRDQVEVIEI